MGTTDKRTAVRIHVPPRRLLFWIQEGWRARSLSRQRRLLSPHPREQCGEAAGPEDPALWRWSAAPSLGSDLQIGCRPPLIILGSREPTSYPKVGSSLRSSSPLDVHSRAPQNCPGDPQAAPRPPNLLSGEKKTGQAAPLLQEASSKGSQDSRAAGGPHLKLARTAGLKHRGRQVPEAEVRDPRGPNE